MGKNNVHAGTLLFKKGYNIVSIWFLAILNYHSIIYYSVQFVTCANISIELSNLIKLCLAMLISAIIFKPVKVSAYPPRSSPALF